MRKIILIFACLCITLSLCGCGSPTNDIYDEIDGTNAEIKDLNGEADFSLASLTDEDICAEKTSYHCVAVRLSSSGSKSYVDKDYLYDVDTVKVSATTPFSGVYILQATYGKTDTVRFTVECARTKGNLRLVLVDENSDIIHDFSVTEGSSYTVNDAKGKEFEIRAAGESAEFAVNVSREFITE